MKKLFMLDGFISLEGKYLASLLDLENESVSTGILPQGLFRIEEGIVFIEDWEEDGYNLTLIE